MKHKYHPAAGNELCDAAVWYEQQRAGLGDEFLDEVDLAITAILELPDRWPEVQPGYRKYRLDRFPYGLIYRRLADDIVQTVAVMELHREPGYWHDRLS